MLTIQRMDELVTGIDQYLQKLDGVTDSLKEIKHTLQELKHSQEKSYLWELEKMRAEFNFVRTELEKRGLPEIGQYETSFREIKAMLQSEEWPRAVDPKAICINDDAAFQRAQAILDIIIGESLTGKSFLDFGCGEGHVVMHALTQNPKIGLGYDLIPSKMKFNNEHFTSEFDMVVKKAPFDIILLQDVLDHLEAEDAITVLKKLKGILSSDGRIYVRNHPWCSRHGSHLYTQINKAFAHLALDEAELSRIGGYVNDSTIKLYDPIDVYRRWFSEAGFKVCSEIPIIKKVEPYFRNQSFIKEKILRHWGGDELMMVKNMEIEFVEYVIEPFTLNQAII